MQTVWKYQVQLGLTRDTEEKLAVWEADMPEDAKFCSFQAQFGQPVMWMSVNTDAKLTRRKFKILATGEPLPETKADERWQYLSSLQIERGMWTWHLHELIHISVDLSTRNG